ncbi:recombinase family protein, partial [Glycomyces rutgersensis]
WLAGIYARVSKDTRKGSGRARASVNQQVSEARDDISDLGTYEGRPILLKETYQRDNDVSASPFATKVREDWPRFVEDVENKRINFVVLWECSRGSREGVEWLTFLSLCRSLSVPIRVVTHGRTYDVRNPRDWKTLADEGIDAEVESAKTSIRVLRDKKDTRQSGRPDGPLCYGHKREYDPDTGELLRQVPEPVESRVVIEIFEEFVGGKPLTAIMRELNERIDLPLED